MTIQVRFINGYAPLGRPGGRFMEASIEGMFPGEDPVADTPLAHVRDAVEVFEDEYAPSAAESAAAREFLATCEAHWAARDLGEDDAITLLLDPPLVFGSLGFTSVTPPGDRFFTEYLDDQFTEGEEVAQVALSVIAGMVGDYEAEGNPAGHELAKARAFLSDCRNHWAARGFSDYDAMTVRAN